MPCFLLILGLIVPRLTLVLLWLFTGWVGRSFDSWIVPALGFLFLPYTLLWWVAVVNLFGGFWGFWQIVFLVLALIADLSSYHRARKRDRK